MVSDEIGTWLRGFGVVVSAVCAFEKGRNGSMTCTPTKQQSLLTIMTC